MFGVVALLCIAMNPCTLHAQVEVEEGNETEKEPEDIAIDDTTLVMQDVEEVFDSSFCYANMESVVCDPNLIKAGLLYDCESNTVVWQKDMNYALPIASVTKIMVALLTIEDIQAGKLRWNDVITTRSYKYVGKRRHKKKVYFERHYTLRDLLKMVMIESNNYAANMVATYAGKGNLQLFIDRMNNKAVFLGMTKTMYTNPSGLPAYRHELDNHSSPHDLLLLAKYAIKNAPLMDIANMATAEVSNGTNSYTIYNHNALVRDFSSEVGGLKTGFTTRAGFCLVACANRYDHKLIAIALGARSSFSRNAFVSDMMSAYYIHLGLGPMGVKLSDEALSLVRPGLDNSRFKYPLVKINPYAIPEASDVASSIVSYKTVYVQAKKMHRVNYGETLSGIAGKYNVSMAQLKSWNKMRSANIRAGQSLAIITKIKKKIPVNEALTSAPAASKAITTTPKPLVSIKKADNSGVDTINKTQVVATKKYYRVKQGEGLIAIARKNNCTVDQIKHWNNISNENIAKGKVLVLYDSAIIAGSDKQLTGPKTSDKGEKTAVANKQTKASGKIKYVYHTVQPGDTLWTIAQRYAGVTVSEIKKANGIRNHKVLLPGTRVKVPIT